LVKITYTLLQWYRRRKQRTWGSIVVEWTMKGDVFDFRAVGARIYILRITTKFLNLSFNRYTLFRKKKEIDKNAFYQKVE
jgi:hypothetical protein